MTKHQQIFPGTDTSVVDNKACQMDSGNECPELKALLES